MLPRGVNGSAAALNAGARRVTLPPPRCLEAEGKLRLPPPPPLPARDSLRIMDMPDAAWSLEPCTSMQAGCCLAAEDRKREATCTLQRWRIRYAWIDSPYCLVSMQVDANCAHHSALRLLVRCRPLSSRFLVDDMTCACVMWRGCGVA